MENKKLKSRNEQQKYNIYVQKKIPKPNYIKNCLWAFIVGGLISTFGQLISNTLLYFGVDKINVKTATPIILIFLGAFFTGLGIYDKLGKRAGAGSIVPITGFANSIVSPAMEFKREGYVLGVGAKLFILAGPVLVYGISSSVVIGLLYYFLVL